MTPCLPVAEPALSHDDAVIRPLAIADAEAAASVIRAAFAAQPRQTQPPSSALRESGESVAGKLASGGGVGAVSGDRLVAIALWQADGDAWMVGRISVLPGARGTGLARALIAACERAARTRGVGRLRLRVRLQLPENEALFTRLGFARVRTEAGHAGVDAPTVAVLEKAIR